MADMKRREFISLLGGLASACRKRDLDARRVVQLRLEGVEKRMSYRS